MKKNIFIALIAALLFVTPSYAEQRVEDMYEQLVNPDMYFKSPQPAPQVEVINKTNSDESSKIESHMPLFKETRLRLLNFIQKHSDKNEKQVYELEKKWAKEDAERAAEEERKMWQGHMYLDYDEEKEKFDEENSNKEAENNEVKSDTEVIDSEKIIGGVKQQVTPKAFLFE